MAGTPSAVSNRSVTRRYRLSLKIRAVDSGPALPMLGGMDRPTTLERAFERARSGEFTDMDQIRWRLKREGYATIQMEGRALGLQLKALCVQAKLEQKCISAH